MRRILLVAAYVFVVSLSASAVAGDQEDCSSDNSDLRIRGCTAIVESQPEIKQTLAIAYYRRGLAYASKKEYDRAIADYTRAIELDPKNLSAYNDRGVAYTSKGDYERAIADVTRAVELAPKPTPRRASTVATSTSPRKKDAPKLASQNPPRPKHTAQAEKAKVPPAANTEFVEQPAWARDFWKN
jgi:tetratricopeptide (TPR) repeat protein